MSNFWASITMNSDPTLETTITYHPVSALQSIVEADHIRLVDSQRGFSWSLKGVDAAMWDLLASGYPFQKIVYFVSIWLGLTEAETKQIVLARLDDWVNQGILEKNMQ